MNFRSKGFDTAAPASQDHPGFSEESFQLMLSTSVKRRPTILPSLEYPVPQQPGPLLIVVAAHLAVVPFLHTGSSGP